MISLVALDVAGTTVDEGGAVYISLKAAIEDALDVTLSEEQLRPALGANKREAIAGFLERYTGEAPKDRIESIYEDFRARLVRSYEERPPVPLPGVTEAFAELRAAGVQVALTTGFSRTVANQILETVGWTVGADENDQINWVVTADDVETGRPAPDLVHKAMEWAGIEDPAQVLVAGDTAYDLASGMNAKAKYVLGVSTGAQTLEQLAEEPHTHLCDVRDIPALIGIGAGIAAEARVDAGA